MGPVHRIQHLSATWYNIGTGRKLTGDDTQLKHKRYRVTNTEDNDDENNDTLNNKNNKQYRS